MNPSLSNPINLPVAYNNGTTPYAARDIARTHGTLIAQMPLVAYGRGLGVERGVGNGMAVAAGTGLSISVATGVAAVGPTSAPEGMGVRVQLSDPINFTDIPASRDSTNPIYLFIAFDAGDMTIVGGDITRPDSYESRQGKIQRADTSTVPGWVPLASITTSATAILTVTDLRQYTDQGLVRSVNGRTPDNGGALYLPWHIVRLASTANRALTGLAAIDGVTPVAGDRILLKDQTTGAENGKWVAASGAWTRANDPITAGESVRAQEGTVSADKLFVNTNTGTVIIGTTSVTYALDTTGNDAAQSANLVKAGPSSGSAAAPTYRALGVADLPASGVTAGTYNNVTVDTKGRVTSASNNTMLPTIVAVTAAATIATSTDIQEVTASSGTPTQTLPASLTNKWGYIVVENFGSVAVPLAATSGTTLRTTYSIAAGAAMSFYLSGTVWTAF
ncbi:hypothetical protein IAD21_00868 [Abditibacteriota bacterium]|nr:hypothetical protein IAD21_00868 [Abditibacteriota bacterium]